MKSTKLLILTLLLSAAFSFESCKSCSPSGRDELAHSGTITNGRSFHHSSTKNVVYMRQEGGVYFIPVKINGVEMEVIFDTGASDITISNLEALFLIKQGKLTEDDILGEAYYQVANGDISVGTIINLRTVQIGDFVLQNVKASVVDNIGAPLLLGQSALAKFGNISIDYSNNTIIFQ